MLLTAALSCRPFQGSRGTLCLVCSRVRAEKHGLCVWLWRASRRSFQEFRGSLRVASAADCCAELSPFHASLCHVGQRCQGLQHCDWVLRVWFSRASGPRRRTTCACVWRASCGAAFRSWHGGHFGWRVLLTAALSCRPYRASLRRVGQRCLGLQLLDTTC